VLHAILSKQWIPLDIYAAIESMFSNVKVYFLTSYILTFIRMYFRSTAVRIQSPYLSKFRFSYTGRMRQKPAVINYWTCVVENWTFYCAFQRYM